MIIFDLDGTLADCEHRRHFVDPRKDPNYIDKLPWKPNWKAFYEACDQDIPIEPVIKMWDHFEVSHSCYPGRIQIWSGRCESVKKKTIKWLCLHLFGLGEDWWEEHLKMRPIGDYTPDDQLKKRWLDEHIASGGKPIEMVFDDRPRMWRDHEIFVFDCNQTGEEF